MDREPWFGYLAGLINMLLPPPPERPQMSDDIFALLIRLGTRLRGDGSSCHHLDEQVAWALRSRQVSLTPETRSTLDVLVRHLVDIHSHGPGTFDIAWHLWRTADSPLPCFSEMMRQEATSKVWTRLWNARGGNADKLRIAVEAIGANHFAERWNDWMQRASQHQPVAMSAAGREVLILLLQACRAVPDAPIDDGLYALCGLRWAGEGNRRLMKEWLGELVHTLAVRPTDRRLACFERLTQNPDTSALPEVSVIYDHLMAAMTDDILGTPRAYTCIDGFPLPSQPLLAAQHRRIDHFLRATTARQTGWSIRGVQGLIGVTAALDNPDLFVQALVSRRDWTRAAQGTEEERRSFRFALDGLARQLLESAPSMTTESITALIESEARLPSTASDALLKAVESHIDSHGYTTPLVEAMRAWHKATHGSFAAIALRHEMGWLLWFEDATPIKLAECWSNHVRASLRTKPKPVQAAWRKLLENVSFGTGEKPPKKWLKPAAKALAAVGAEEFRASIRAWFEPFRGEQPLRLTVVGRDILRNLLFYALLAEDAAVDEAITWFAAARWKTKKDQTSATVLLSAFTHVLIERNTELAYDTFTRHPLPLAGKNLDRIEELSTTLRRPMPSTTTVAQRALPAPLAAMRKAMTAMLTGPASRLEGDELIITGKHDTYTLRIAE